MKCISLSLIAGMLIVVSLSAQDNSTHYLSFPWRTVATEMPEQWYGTEDAKRVAENVMFAQKDIGGWAKNLPYHHVLSDAEKKDFIKGKTEVGATFDNGATITELRFLANVYEHIPDVRYSMAFKKGLNYIFIAQYDNGGWPQFFPVQRDGDYYSRHITYNDDAMVNTMRFLKKVYLNDSSVAGFNIDANTKQKAMRAFKKGIECILKTQIVVEGNPTVWCAQHDEKTFEPAKARAYELPSFSGMESASIVLLLMEIENPSIEIITSVEGAMKWFQTHKVEGIRLESEINSDGKKDRKVVEDVNAPPLWGRFYDLETEKPFFCDRDGIKKNTMAEIGYERRNGYAWYTDAPRIVLAAYPEWREKLSRQ